MALCTLQYASFVINGNDNPNCNPPAGVKLEVEAIFTPDSSRNGHYAKCYFFIKDSVSNQWKFYMSPDTYVNGTTTFIASVANPTSAGVTYSLDMSSTGIPYLVFDDGVGCP